MFRTALAVTLLSGSLATHAAAQSLSFLPGTPYSADNAVVFNNVVGPRLNGLSVSFGFTDGSFESGVWGLISDPDIFGVRTDNASVRVVFNPDGTFWRINLRGFEVRNLRSMRLNGGTTGVVFDCSWSGTACGATGSEDGSAQSGRGGSLQTVRFDEGNQGASVRAEYANLVGIGDAAPVGDLFEQVTFFFDGDGLIESFSDDEYRFTIDADRYASLAPVTTTEVPEPATWMLMVAGLGMLGVARRRRSA